jgi:DNA-binding NarL/FixJ family response regulator
MNAIKVGLVEDDAIIRNSLLQLLEQTRGFACVAHCATGEDALERLPRLKPDAVLMDINLPKMSGVECTARLKESLPDTQIMMLTVFEDSQHIFNALKAGASGYLLKRSEPAEVLEAIRDIRQGGAPMSSQIARKVVQAFRTPKAAASPAARLTRREEEILGYLSEGYSDKEIADKLSISIPTVRTHLTHIYEKLHVQSRTEAVIKYLNWPSPTEFIMKTPLSSLLRTLVLLPLLAGVATAGPAPNDAAGKASARWSPERANAWYAAQPWLVGANFVPSTAINQLEMWQAGTFDPATIDRELGYAQGVGMNTMRVFLHDLAWREDPEGFFKRIVRFLEIADRRGIRTMFCIFDGVWHPLAKPGPQPDPKPGVHNSGWVQSPGREALSDPARQDALKPYVLGLLTRFGHDRRVLAWDLFNEPDNLNTEAYGPKGSNIELPEADKVRCATQLLRKTLAWAREANPTQPITCGVWLGDYLTAPSEIQKLSLEESDIISLHNYDGREQMRQRVEGLKQLGRPVLCTEYMARGNHCTFEAILPMLKALDVAAYNWGLVNGKSQTIYPWDSWKQTYATEPPLWFHDVFHRDGSLYLPAEGRLLRQLTGRGDRSPVK